MSSEFVAELLKIPPVTRFLCAAQLAVSLPVMLQLVSPYQVVLIWRLVIKQYEVSYHLVDVGAELQLGLDMESLYKLLPGK